MHTGGGGGSCCIGGKKGNIEKIAGTEKVYLLQGVVVGGCRNLLEDDIRTSIPKASDLVCVTLLHLLISQIPDCGGKTAKKKQ